MNDDFVKKAVVTSICVIVVTTVIMLVYHMMSRNAYEVFKKDLASFFSFDDPKESKPTNTEVALKAEIEASKRRAELEYNERLKRENSDQCRFWKGQKHSTNRTQKVNYYCGWRR